MELELVVVLLDHLPSYLFHQNFLRNLLLSLLKINLIPAFHAYMHLTYCYVLDFLGSVTSAPCRITMG
jgi:hypothetical protein